ncbi:MAG: bacteriophage holin [Halobacteriales archaeon]
MAPTNTVDRRALGIAVAAVWAGYVAVLGAMARSGWGERCQRLLADVYRGYDDSVGGIGIGVAWAALDGFIAGWTVAAVYEAVRAGSTAED